MIEMIADPALARAELCELLPSLDEALRLLAASIRGLENYPAWVPPDVKGDPARQQAAQILRQIEYEDGQDPNHTITGPGALGVTEEILEAARRINEQKDRLKVLLSAMRGHKTADRRGQIRLLVDVALEALGFARLHKQQATRRITVLDSAPVRIGITVGRNTRFSRISVAQALELAEALPDQAAREFAISRLSSLDRDEPLAQVVSDTPTIRANLVFLEQGSKVRAQKPASMPLLYPASAGDKLPITSYSDARGKPRLARADRKISTEVYVAPLKLYRYEEQRTAN